MCCTLRAASAAALFCAVSAASADVIDFQSLSVSARQAFAPFADTDMATDFGSLTGSSPSAVGVNASSSQPNPFNSAAIGAAIQPLSGTLTGSSILQSYDYDVNTRLDRLGPVAAGALVLTSHHGDDGDPLVVQEASLPLGSGMWTEPVDLDVTRQVGRVDGGDGFDQIGGVIEGGATIATADGRGHFIKDGIPGVTVMSLISPRGG